MRTFTLHHGVRIRMEGETCRLVEKFSDKGTDTWQLERLSDHCLINLAETALLTLHVDGKLVLETDEQDESQRQREARRKREKTILADLPSEDRAKLEFRIYLVREVEKCLSVGMRTIKPPGSDKTFLKLVLQEICEKKGLREPISIATFYRWRKRYSKHGDTRSLLPRFSERGRDQLPPTVKRWLLDALGALLLPKPGQSITSARAAVKLKIDDANRADPTLGYRQPTKKVFYSYYNQIPAIDRATAKYGPTRSRHMFRATRGQERPAAPLDLVQFDETVLDLYVVDETFGVPLGSPWLSWCLDANTQVPTGLYLGFEPPGDVALMATLRHAILPKTYISTLYPNIRTAWPTMGIPRMLLVDNGLSQHGRTLENLALDLDFDIKFTPVRTPWFKAAVENAFGLLNKMLLKELPGFKPKPGTVLDKYNPTRQGLIGLNALLFIIHKWVCDVYLLRPHTELSHRPLDLWISGSRRYPPTLIGDVNDLDSLFGIVRPATLDHRGVVFEGLRYHSDELHQLLSRKGQLRLHGARMDVKAKVNHSDLADLRVFDPDNNVWIKAVALRLDYARGLDLHRHQIYRKYARDRAAPDDPDAWLIGHHEIQQFVAEALPRNLNMRSNKLMARFLGKGTHSLFKQIDQSGNLEPAASAAQADDALLSFRSPLPAGGSHKRPPPRENTPANDIDSYVVPDFPTDESLT